MAKCTLPGKEDVTFATFVPTSPSDAALPVFLFQSGYGSSSVGHTPLMEAIASKGCKPRHSPATALPQPCEPASECL